MHYHLWLKPSGALYDGLACMMKSLRQPFRGPVFDPHITLLGEIEGDERDCCEKADALAGSLPAIKIRLDEPAFQEDYFHCLYMTVNNTPALLRAHQQAMKMFGRSPHSPFHPHVSLLYGLYPLRVKQAMIQSLPPGLPSSGLANKIVLVRAESTNPQDWYSVKVCRLAE